MSAFGGFKACRETCLCYKCTKLIKGCNPCNDCVGEPHEEVEEDQVCGYMTNCQDYEDRDN